LRLDVLQRAHHRRQTALHVVGAAPDQAVPSDLRLELLGSPGNHVEVTVEDHTGDAVTSADVGDQHRQPSRLVLVNLDVA
jgi:hypothetical protein